VGTLLDDTPEGPVPAESTKTQSLSKRRRLSLSGTENCTQPSGVASTSRNQIVSDPLPVEPLPSNLWPFDNAAFYSAFSAEQISQDLSAPLEIELFDPSRLFADFDPVVAANGEMNNIVLLFTSLMQLTGVQDHAASHPDSLFHSPSTANYGESSGHVTQSCKYFNINSSALLTPYPSYICNSRRISTFRTWSTQRCRPYSYTPTRL